MTKAHRLGTIRFFAGGGQKRAEAGAHVTPRSVRQPDTYEPWLASGGIAQLANIPAERVGGVLE